MDYRRGRGRGSSTSKRIVAPNLAAAAVGHVTDHETPSASGSRRGGGRGRGKDSNRSTNDREMPKRNPRPRIIESEGILSQGFSDERLPRRSKRYNDGEKVVIGKIEGLEQEIEGNGTESLKKNRKMIKPNQKISPLPDLPVSFIDYWISDEEHDDGELLELMRDDFIADLPRASQIPLVLPAKDASQFNKLLSKDARLDLDFRDIKENGMSNINEIVGPSRAKKTKMKTEIFSDGSDNESSLFLKNSQANRATAIGETLRNIIKDGLGPLMLFQLPSNIKPSVPSERIQESTNRSMEVQLSSNSLESTKQNACDLQPKGHCLEQFPTGIDIGKLQFMRSGRVLMSIGDQQLDVSEAISSDCSETIVRIETQLPDAVESSSTANGIFNCLDLLSQPSPNLNNPTSRISSFISTAQSERNTAEILGEVPYSFVCSYNFQRIFDQHR